MDVFLNIIFCSVFIVLIKFFSLWTQKPDDEIFRKQLEMRFKEWKFFFFIREIIEDLAAAVALIIILHSAVSTPAISKEMESLHITVTGYEYLYITFLVLIVLYIVLSFLQGDVFTRIGKDNIQCRTPNGKKYVIHYTDLTSYSISPHGNLKLYKKDQCVLSVTSQKKKDVLIEILKNRKIPRQERQLLVLELEKNYILFSFACYAFSIFMFLMGVYLGELLMVGLFFICIMETSSLTINALTSRIIVEDNMILKRSGIWKHIIKFSDIKYLTLEKQGNTEIICIHSNRGGVIKVPKYCKNIKKFEAIISEQHWRYKTRG